ncbi:MAG: hypothetical protein VB142_01360 [Burkholderia sp.]
MHSKLFETALGISNPLKRSSRACASMVESSSRPRRSALTCRPRSSKASRRTC